MSITKLFTTASSYSFQPTQCITSDGARPLRYAAPVGSPAEIKVSSQLSANFPELRTLGRTLKRWFDKIMTFQQTRLTNDPTEWLNNLIKRVKRVALGLYNFEKLQHPRASLCRKAQLEGARLHRGEITQRIRRLPRAIQMAPTHCR